MNIMRRDSTHHNNNNTYTDIKVAPPVRWERNMEELNNEYIQDEKSVKISIEGFSQLCCR